MEADRAPGICCYSSAAAEVAVGGPIDCSPLEAPRQPRVLGRRPHAPSALCRILPSDQACFAAPSHTAAARRRARSASACLQHRLLGHRLLGGSSRGQRHMAAYQAYGGSGYGPLAAERQQQVDDLVRQFPGARAINPDRSVFDLPLELNGKKATVLRISLPPHFPQERPALSVLVPVVNPAVDPSGRVHTSLLSTWVYGSSRLSSAVAEAVAALSGGPADSRQPAGGGAAAAAGGPVPFPAGYPVPPGPLMHSRPLLHGGQAAAGAAAGGGGGGSRGSSPQRHSTVTPGPATSSALPDFSRYSAAQLEELLADGPAFKALLREAIKGSPMAATLEDIRVKNRQLAESNLSKQNAINEVQNQLAIVKSSEYTLIKSSFDELYGRQSKVLGAMGGVVWREKLEEAVSAADSASGALKADFLSGQLPLEEFVRQHLAARTQHHVLDLKRQAAEQLLGANEGERVA